MTAAQIKALRKALVETTRTFGARFLKSARTVENWEQGRYRPDALVLREMAKLRTRAGKRIAS